MDVSEPCEFSTDNSDEALDLNGYQYHIHRRNNDGSMYVLY